MTSAPLSGNRCDRCGWRSGAETDAGIERAKSHVVDHPTVRYGWVLKGEGT